jgi:hypothetical protein
MNKKNLTSMQSLVGIVTPFEWDERDQVCQVSLSATDDEEYIIENSERFLDLVQKPIRAAGVVKFGKKTHRSINIKKFELLDYSSLFEHVYPEYSRVIGNRGNDVNNSELPSKLNKKKGRHGKSNARPFS